MERKKRTKPESYINVSLTDDKVLHFTFSLSDKANPEDVGRLLYSLTTNRYSTSIVGAIEDYVKNTNDERGSMVIDYWMTKIRQTRDVPVVRPSEAFPRNTHGR